MTELADPVQMALLLWGVPGLLVALAFLGFGIDRIDPSAAGAYALRPLLIPGLVLLWPLVLWRWRALSAHREG